MCPRPGRDGRAGARVQHHVHGAVQNLSASEQGIPFRIKQPTIEIKKTQEEFDYEKMGLQYLWLCI